MPTTVIFGSLAIGLSLPLLWWAFAGARTAGGGGVAARVLRRGEASADLRQLTLAESAGRRVVAPWVHRLVRRLRRITPPGWIEALERSVVLGGLERRWPMERVLVANAATAAAGVLVAVLQLQGGITTAGVVAASLVAGIGVFGPATMLSRRARLRQERIERELPDALDQITMGVEAGLGFEGALSRVADTGRGPLAAEFTRVLKEMHMGVSRTAALRNLAERTDVLDLDTFVVAVTQAENYGLPIARVLRSQAGDLRTKRRQRAEERALKVPVKLIFPLGFCIFPSLFIVIAGPAAIRIWRAFLA